MLSPLQKVKNLYTEVFGWTGEDLIPIDFCFAAYMTPFLKGAIEKAWGDLCGPASVGKTEILRCFEDDQVRTIALDNLTPNAFASAYRDEDNPEEDKSLCYLLSRDRDPIGAKVLILRDMSSFYNMSKERTSKLFSDLRTAFEGSYTNMAGNIGIDFKKNLQFGLLTSGTESADEFRRRDQSLGSRTFVCRMGAHLADYDARRALAQKTIGNDPIRLALMRTKIKAAAQKAINDAILRIKLGSGKVLRPEGMERKVALLAAIATSIRTVPTSGTAYARFAEGPSRMTKQFESWLNARTIVDARESWNDDDFCLVRRIAQDTMPPDHLRAIRILWRGSYEESVKPLSADYIRDKGDLSADFWRQLTQWKIIKIIREHDDNAYSLTPQFAKDIREIGYMENLFNGPKD